MTKHGDSRFTGRQAMLREQVSDGAIRRALLPQLFDDILCWKQIVEFLRTARREFFNRLADCGWVKCGHGLEFVGCGPGN